jgi:hypothetical protein
MVYLPLLVAHTIVDVARRQSATDPAALMPAIRRAVQTIDPEIAIGDARSLDALVDTSVAARRYQMQLFFALRPGGVVHRDARRLRGHLVRRLAAPPRDEHPGRTRRAASR